MAADNREMFGSSSIKRAISIGFAILLVLMGCLAGVSANRMLHVLDVQRMHAEGLAPAAKLADDFQREMLNARINLIYFVTIQKPGSREQGMKHLRNAENALAAFTALVGRREELGDLRSHVASLNGELAEYETELAATVKLVEGGNTSGDAYTAQIKAWAARGALLVGDADKTQEISAEMSGKRNEENIESLRTTAIGSIAFFATSFAISIVVAVMIVIRINQRLRQIIVSLDESAVHISNSSKEIAHASQALAKNSSTQAATIEETSAATTQVNSMAVRTRDHAETTSSIAERSLAGCAATNTSLSEMEEAMEAIHDSSQRVSKIIKTIDGIAFQTNILALNAAVEAARAGSQGEGFAVVAEEVRHLAERCAKAAQDTTKLVTESIGRSTNGQRQSKKVAADMQVVTEESQHIRELVEEMQVGSREQSRGIEQINRAISELERITQSSAAQAEEGAASSAELSNQADLMSRLVVDLKTLVEGSNGRQTTPGASVRGGRSRSRTAA